MTSNDSKPPESSPEDRSPSQPALSVDQLTQAFAQLMGDEHRADSLAPADAETESPPPPVAAPPDDDGDLSQVTPSSILEAMLFVGHPRNEPLTSRRMASYLRGVSPEEVNDLIELLNQQYAQQRAPYQIVSVGAGYRMALRDEFVRLREGFYGRVRTTKLSQSAVDLLAIVAYHQPIARDEIDRLRGQSSGGTLAQLVRRQLLQVEYSQEKPRKKIYRTTDRFLDLFGLDSLDDLPSYEDF